MNPKVKYPTIKKMVNSKQGTTRIYGRVIKRSVMNLAKNLEGSKTQGTFSLDLLDADDGKYSISLKDGKAKLQKGADERAGLSIRTDRATWLEITTGRMSPVDAYLSGRMEVGGELSFIKRLYAMVASKPVEELN